MIYEKISDINLLLSGLPQTALVEIDTGTASFAVTVATLLAAQNQIQALNTDVEAFTPGMVLAIPAAGHAQVAIINGTFAQAFAQALAVTMQAVGITAAINANGYQGGFVGLTPGPIWLGPGGTIVSAPPNVHGSYNVPLGRAISATEVIFNPGTPTLYR